MLIQIDEHAGVCPGVLRAITLAEKELEKGNKLVSVGPLIHNRFEIERLRAMGLQAFEQSIFETNTNWEKALEGHKLLIRTHGISPCLRQKLLNVNFSLVDATCPTVLRSQKLVAEYSDQDYQIVIIGKPGHPEVIGLSGHAKGATYVITGLEDLEQIDCSQKTFVIAQTTIDINLFNKLRQLLKGRIPEIEVVNTVCGAMKARCHQLRGFVRSNELILFVGGHNSSNTTVLFNICRQENNNSFHIDHVDEIDRRWFNGCFRIGITGSASTPRWQLEDVRIYLEHFVKN